MSLWNPYAFSVTGQAMAPVSPAALRVYGGPATPEQRAMAQGVFVQFCGRARLSPAPNPTEQGVLADGTRYRIVMVGLQATMELWPASALDGRGIYGIGIILTSIEGATLPGHSLPDGSPQPYVMTPEPIKGTRKTQGLWKIRKVPSFFGGKASFCDSTGKLMIAAIGGLSSDGGLNLGSAIERRVGVNVRAYWSGVGGPGTTVLATGAKVAGEFRTESEPVPFFRKASDGRVWLLSIVPDIAQRRTRLYGQPYTGQPFSGPIGELLGFVDTPYPYSLQWQTVSVKPDGTNVRATATGLFAETAKVDLQVLEVASNPPSFTLGALSIGASENIETPGSVVTTSVGDLQNFTTTTTREAGRIRVAGGYGYSVTGADQSYTVSQPSSLASRSGFARVSVRVAQTYHPDSTQVATREQWQDSQEDWVESAISYEFEETSTVIPGSRGHSTSSSYRKDTFDRAGNRLSSTGNGAVVSQTDSASSDILFVDVPNALVVVSIARTIVDFSSNSTDGGTTETTTETKTYKTAIWHKGSQVFTVDYSDRPDTRFAVMVAADPYTGALCLNLLEIPPGSARASKSWLYLVDATGVRPLSQFMTIPTTARAKADNALLSVV